MQASSRLLAGAGVVVAALALAGCASPPVQDYAYAAPAGYHYSPEYGYFHGGYTPDGVYVGTGATPASPSYVIPTPAPSSPNSSQQTQPAASRLPDRGAPVFGLGGIAGTVTFNNGRFATVAPQGGGPLGIMTPQGNGTGLLSVPGHAPTIVLARP